MRTRRDFLGLIAGTAIVGVIPVPAVAADGSWDVSYVWSSDLAAVLDYREVVADTLGPEIARDLVIVRGGTGNWGLIYDRSGVDRITARSAAIDHHRKLKAALGGRESLATILPDQGFERTHHVSYGVVTSSDEARARYDLIAQQLGSDVHADLVIEVPEAGRWTVIYKRYGTLQSTTRLAEGHTRLLARHRITAAAVADRYLDERWAAGSEPVVQADPATAEPPSPRPPIVQPDAPAAATAASPAAATASPAAAPAAASPAATPVVARAPVAATRARHMSDSERANLIFAESGLAAMVGTRPPRKRPARPPVATPSRTASAPATRPQGTSDLLPAIQEELPAAIATPMRDAINTHVQGLRRRRIIDADETTSWYVHTLHDNRTWAAINAERSLQCASMVKPYVALAFMHQVGKGRIAYGRVSKANLEAMIQRSSNSATNWAISTLGGPAAVQRILTSSYGDVLRETSIVEAIPSNGRTYKNRSSARDYVRFSRALWAGEFPHSAEIKRLMALPGRDRLYTGAPDIPVGTQVMNKTGTTSKLCGDFGILVARTRAGQQVPYAIVGIIEKRRRADNFSAWAASRGQVIRGVSNLAYQVLERHYGLA